MRIETGGWDLLKTETFLAVGLGETTIAIDEGPETIRFILNFVETEDDEKASSLRWDPIDSTALRLTLTNWSNPLGTTLMEPVEVGTYDNRKLFALLFVQKAGAEGQLRSITFSLYLGEEVHNGDNQR